MPTYDYKCSKCRRSVAVVQSILDPPLKKCAKCGGKLEKMLPKTVSLIFKGSGFYVTDYKKGGAGSKGGAGKGHARGKTAPTGGKDSDERT
ncbi:MAG: FmdB family zinc ribbon protein [bacterium]